MFLNVVIALFREKCTWRVTTCNYYLERNICWEVFITLTSTGFLVYIPESRSIEPFEMAACVDCASPGDDQPATFLGTVVSESWRSDRMLFSFLFRNIFCSTKVRRFVFQQDFLSSGFELRLGDGAIASEKCSGYPRYSQKQALHH